ncbi:uncharacterized protein BO66DRAFT_390307 [Aspergillus aculeatinus CBS 121060]|uniref:Uncharacterized protein n=1 Tax=Aspergillus aculeatinus CBS 121060 TaxID=1448322 RepID=A0ACD1HFP7_9EURO|nr:hypothetical protein BO66DRAFT_390307 [Aspergillus aculeatinus CBS 121060]RAH72191.1 hypothetical protein BO66DRAFT_390307 [Aspergillus aculeatinus CBS 121060]
MMTHGTNPSASGHFVKLIGAFPLPPAEVQQLSKEQPPGPRTISSVALMIMNNPSQSRLLQSPFFEGFCMVGYFLFAAFTFVYWGLLAIQGA